MRNCWTATSYAEYHRNGCTHAAYSPGCRPLGSHSRLATTPSTMPRRLHRYKTLPARNPRGPNRYKTLPARPKYLFSAHFAPAGRTLYRFHHHQAEQGEFSTAYGTTYGTKLSQHARNTPFRRILRQQGEFYTASTTTKPSRANFLPHTEPPTVQNSPDTRPRRAIPVQNSPDTRPRRPQPVQNSPSMPETPLFGAFCASRENFVPLPPPPSRAGRKKSRTGRAKRGGASPYNPRNALIAGISRTAWTRPAR